MTEIFHGITNVGKGLLKDLIEGNTNQVIIKTTFGLMGVIITPSVNSKNNFTVIIELINTQTDILELDIDDKIKLSELFKLVID